MNLLTFFALTLKASLFSTSGFGNVPSLHSDLISQHATTELQFGEALAVGQVSPGPNGLWVVSLGYLMNGWICSVMALMAITIPPMIVLLFNRVYRRIKHHAAVEGFVWGLSLAVVGVFAVAMAGLLYRTGLDGKSVGIMLGSVGLMSTKRVPIVVILLLAAEVGVLAR